MAASIRSPAVTLAILTIFASVACTASYGGLVGGKTEIADVKTNKEVQDLGRFSVEEHNRRLTQSQKEEEVLTFVEVVEAQQQVVSGIKYYMKISATQSGGDSRMFDSVVVVKPWLRSKQLLNFAPST
ncbi:Cysteine proteinase inhibitor 10 [Spatholobus suberectus]|nr:Cysteine proteinase inhibitor 10 [Spatholobus suberectus]